MDSATISLDMQEPWHHNVSRLKLLGHSPLDIAEHYRSYVKRYMRSARWRVTRQRILDAHSGCCARCGVSRERYKVDVHHLTYARLGGEEDADLLPLCYRCHGTIHYVRSMYKAQ